MNKTNSDKTGLVTAYKSNTRQQKNDDMAGRSGWAEEIDNLLYSDYSFLACQYSANAVLFRGMSSGLISSVQGNKFGLYKDAKPHAELEHELNVYFVSHELSDAITSSRLWDEVNDAGIIVLGSDLFNQHYQDKNAATMAFAEPGFVFKYPFFIEPLTLADIKFLIVNKMTAVKLEAELDSETWQKLQTVLFICELETDADTRENIESEIRIMLSQRSCFFAEPVACDSMPKLIK